MKLLPQLSTRWLMVATALAAANLAWLRVSGFLEWRTLRFSEAVRCTSHSLLMANALIVGTPALVLRVRRGRWQPFLVGFIVAGWISVFWYVYCYHYWTKSGKPIVPFGVPFGSWIDSYL